MTKNFTVNFWYKPGPFIAEVYRAIFTKNNAQAGIYIDDFSTSTNIIFYENNGGGYEYNNTNLRRGVWSMVTLVVKNNVGQWFLNGSPDSLTFEAIDVTFDQFGYTHGSYTANGDIDECGIWSRSLNCEDILDLYNRGNGLDPYFFRHANSLQQNLITFHHFDNNLIDEVSTTTLGAVNYGVTYVDGKFNKALNFNGANFIDAVGDLNTYAYMHQTGVFSISTWIKFNNFNTVPQYMMGSSPTTVQEGFYLGNISHGGFSGALEFTVCNGISTEFVYHPIVDQFFTDNGWYHVVLVADNTNIYIYKNSILVGTFPKINALSVNTSFNKLNFGQISTYGTDRFNGNLDQTGFWDRTLTVSEIKRLYNKGFSTRSQILSDEGTINDDLFGYWKLNNNTLDYVNNYHGVPTGIAYQTGLIDKCAHFNGAGTNKINCGHIPLANLDKFSITAWVKPDSFADQYMEIASMWPSGNQTVSFTFYGNRYLVGFIGDGIGGFAYFFFDFTSYDGNWAHCCLVYDGTQTLSADRLKAYYNGANVPNIGGIAGTLLEIPTNVGPAAGEFNIGYLDGSNYIPKGKIDEVGLWKIALTPQQVSDNYNSGLGVDYKFKTVSNQRPSLKVGLLASWNLDGDVTDVLGNYDGFNEVGTAYVSGLIGQCWQGAGGNLPRVDIPTVPGLTEFTMSFWIKKNLISSDFQCIFGSFPLNTYCAFINGQNVIQFVSGSGIAQTPDGILPLGVWTNVTVTISSGIGKIYINGKLKARGTGFTPAGFDKLGYFGFGAPFTADLDLYSMWGKALTEEEILEYYNKGNGIQYPFDI